MYRNLKSIVSPKGLAGSAVLLAGCFYASGFGATAPGGGVAPEGPAVLWRDPSDMATRDLYYGPGGKEQEPRGTFTFEKEDRRGSSPKFDVVDEKGVGWRVKMGGEARPETVASRLVWAAGYFANEDYFVSALRVQNLPRLTRGKSFVSRDGMVHNVRLKRHLANQKKIGTWSWSANPFLNSRELNGLRVLMAVLNNWDLKDVNNAVYQVKEPRPEQRYVISDLGASFGTPGLNWTNKGDVKAYCRSKMIKNVSGGFVDFNTPAGPPARIFFDLPEVVRREGLLWLGRHVPVADAVWMGRVLARIRPDQIRDAFRAGGYSPGDIEALSRELEHRIQELQSLGGNKVAVVR